MTESKEEREEEGVSIKSLNPYTISAAWKIGGRSLAKASTELAKKDGSLLLRIIDETKMPVHSVRIGDKCCGEYSFKKVDGILPNKKYLVEVGVINDEGYSRMLESNEAATSSFYSAGCCCSSSSEKKGLMDRVGNAFRKAFRRDEFC